MDRFKFQHPVGDLQCSTRAVRVSCCVSKPDTDIEESKSRVPYLYLVLTPTIILYAERAGENDWCVATLSYEWSRVCFSSLATCCNCSRAILNIIMEYPRCTSWTEQDVYALKPRNNNFPLSYRSPTCTTCTSRLPTSSISLLEIFFTLPSDQITKWPPRLR